MEKNRPRLLIPSRNLALLRGHYEDVIVALVRAGVRVSIRYVNDKGLSADDYRETLLRRGCDVRLDPFPRDERDPGDWLALRLRQLANLLRFAHPDYREREWLQEARFDKAAPGPERWARRLKRTGSRVALVAIRLASSVDRVLPPQAAARALLAAERPDAVAAVDVDRVPEFVDVLKAAAWEHVPTAIWIQSWDNLTSKGLVHFTPDRVFVWNLTQRDELARYHGIPGRHVCVTGAQTFDHWFTEELPSDRAAFCAQNGLDPERPIILYLASSRLAEVSPADFFLRWLKAIRSSGDPVLEGATVLVRPHPTYPQPWLGLENGYPGLSVSPSTSEAPMNSAEYRRRFRDELHHASVAVGINTSAMIDAAILGKPVCTVELPELTKGQRGTVHFEYMMTVGGGFLRTATSLEEHVVALAELVRKDPYQRDERSARFVHEFVRPHGLDVAPATVFSEEMHRLLKAPSELHLPGPVGRTVGHLIHRAAPLLGAPLEDAALRRWTHRWRTSLTKLITSWRTSLTKLITSWRTSLTKLITSWRRSLTKVITSLRKTLLNPLHKGLVKPLRKMLARHRKRGRARLKPIRRFFLVRLRAAVRARLQRFAPQRRPAKSPQAKTSERRH